MDKFTETRQKLGLALYELMKKTNTSGHISFGEYQFFAMGEGADQNYVYSMGWKKSGLGVMAIRRRWNRMEDAVSDATTVADMETCLGLMPSAEEYMLSEQRKFEEASV